jgi:drug/metabolite transporter (DMT)-like permease
MATDDLGTPDESSVSGDRSWTASTQLHLALLAVQLSFSGLHVVGKVVLQSMSPLALACLRVLFATPFLLIIAWRRGGLNPGLRWLPWLAVLGLLGVFLNQVLFIVGLSFTSATNAAILMPSIPVFAVGMAALLGIESIGRYRLLGVGFAVVGALVILNPTRFSLAERTLLGNLIILVNCWAYATFLVLQRPLLRRLPWQTVLAWAFLFGSAGVLAVGAGALGEMSPHSLPTEAWWGIAFIVLFPTLLGYQLNTWAVGRSSALLVAVYVTLQPLLTAVLSSWVLAELPTWRQLLGFVLIAAGLLFVSWRRDRRPEAL